MTGPTELAMIELHKHLSPEVQRVVKSAVDYELHRTSLQYDEMADDILDLTDAFEEIMRDCEARIEDAAATHADMAAE
jgi:hypothetical protein